MVKEIFTTALRSADFYQWKDDKPVEDRLNTAYSERFILSLIAAQAAAGNGYEVKLARCEGDEWPVLAVEGMPLFHISPEDFRVKDMEALPVVEWKGTAKPGEFRALMAAVSGAGKDLAKIAKEKT